MKKSFILTVLLLLALIVTPVCAAVLQATAAPHIKIVVDGAVHELKDANGDKVDPVIINGTTYLPVRSIANALGKEVAWDEKTSTVTIGRGLPQPANSKKIGVSMPTQSLQRWNQDGDWVATHLMALGYEVDLQYAENEVATQIAQIENMILGDCKVLVIACIDGGSLSNVLAAAKDRGITVIAYDRLIFGTDAVTYYATFDNYMVGTIQGDYIKDALKLDTAAGTFNIEIFAGAPDDTNAVYFYQGAMDVLQPYIDSGKLKVLSGQTQFEDVAISVWSAEKAQVRMDNLIDTYYSKGERLDAVLSSNDSLAIGIANALENAGYGFADKPFPIITGQDGDIPNCKYILAGKQSMSVFKDMRTLTAKAAEMADAAVKGSIVPVNDTAKYNNGVKVVPTFLCAPIFIDKDNLYEILIEPGYWAKEQVYN